MQLANTVYPEFRDGYMKWLPTEVLGFAGFLGNYWYVKPNSGSDSNSGTTPSAAFKTLGKALASATANNGDVVFLVAESNTASATTDYQPITTGTIGLNWNKDGVHLIGVSNDALIGSRSRIAQLASVTTMTDLLTISANDCLIANVEIFQGVASSTASYERALVVSGARNRFVNCQISGNGDTALSMDDANSRSLYISGNENSFQHCYIGLDTSLRATQTAEVEILGTAAAPIARTIFEECTINSWTSLGTFKALKTTYIDRFVQLKNCILGAVQNVTSATAPTGAIINATPNGTVNILGGGVFGYANISTLTDSAILVLSYAGLPTHATYPGIAQGQQTT